MKTAIIVGVNGQDGSYMKELLESKDYRVHGFGSDWGVNSMLKAFERYKPNEIYNFASTSNVFKAWENLDRGFETDGQLPCKILEFILRVDKSIKYFQASSCLTFGRNADGVQNELTPLNPIHPYGIAKAYADMMVKEFRQVHGLFACSGIFYNHESPRRGNDFFSKRIVRAAAKGESIKVGNIDSMRDMGYAPDFMEAVYLMMQNEEPKDYVIGTGQLISMREFAKKAFEYVGLNYENYLVIDETLHRTNDTNILKADTTKIKAELGWQPKTTLDEMIKIMIDHEGTV